MNLYQTIYDQDGTPFEVTPERAAELVLNKGWSNIPPAKKTAKRKYEKKAAVEITADTEEVSEDVPSSFESE